MRLPTLVGFHRAQLLPRISLRMPLSLRTFCTEHCTYPPPAARTAYAACSLVIAHLEVHGLQLARWRCQMAANRPWRGVRQRGPQNTWHKSPRLAKGKPSFLILAPLSGHCARQCIAVCLVRQWSRGPGPGTYLRVNPGLCCRSGSHCLSPCLPPRGLALLW